TKIKSAISRKAYKKVQTYKAANQSKNKRIADFIFAKERSYFRKRIAQGRVIFTDSEIFARAGKTRATIIVLRKGHFLQIMTVKGEFSC
ncbi:MAG: hypothetical protein K6B74_02940, partial [Ruminococcus sp.]|nr:hypothetical protein [Ruminococcus sp.]